jgi:hypothetical protein
MLAKMSDLALRLSRAQRKETSNSEWHLKCANEYLPLSPSTNNSHWKMFALTLEWKEVAI